MGLIKLIIKLLVLPLIVAVTMIQWVGIFFTQFSTVIFNLLAELMFLITIAGWMFGISAGAETLRLLAVAFVVFIIPCLLYTSPSPRDYAASRMPSSA